LESLKTAEDQANADAFHRMFEAVIQRDFPALEQMLKSGVDANIEDGPANASMLSTAIKVGFVDGALLLIKHGVVVTARSPSEQPPLAVAATKVIEEDSLIICQALLTAGADPNERDRDQRTALHEAAILGRAALCKLLVEHGAEVEVETRQGFSPLRAIAGNTNEKTIDTMRVLTQAGASTSSLPTQMINRGDQRLSAFQIAVASNHKDNVSFFLSECGEDPAQITEVGCTMEDLAGRPQMKELLRAAIAERAVTSSIDHGLDTQTSASRSKEFSCL
jgi:hypothetical protein